MGYSDDNDISKPSDNFAYKDEKEKNELHDQMYSAKCSLELKFLMLMLSLGLLLGAGSLLYTYINSR
jgi:hypothetical protein